MITQLGLSSTFLSSKEDAFSVSAPLQKGWDFTSNKFVMRLLPTFTDLVDTKADASQLLLKSNVSDTYTKTETDAKILATYPWIIGNPSGQNTLRTGSVGLNFSTGVETVIQITGTGIAGNEGRTYFYKDVLFFQAVEMQRTLNANMIKAKGASGGGGIVRCLPASNDTESSIGFYKYTDERAVAAGDMWVVGQGAWNEPGFSIGTPTRGACLNINSEGAVSVPNYTTTPAIMTDTIRAQTDDHLTIDESVIITGNLTVNGTINASFPNAFWCAGKYDGINMSRLSSKGRYGYGVSRAGGYAAGVYTITMNNVCADDNYVINATMQTHGFLKVWETSPPTLNTFTIVCYNLAGQLVNSVFHFSVIA
jgi:hypothetical protein